MPILAKHFRDETAAFVYLEGLLWSKRRPVCPHCGAIDNAGRLQGVRGKPNKKNPQGPLRHGLWKCREKDCRKQFTVTIGTIFQGNHLPLHQTLRAFHLIFCTPNITGHRLSRRLGIDYKSAWLLRDRIKNALRNRS